MTLQVFRKMSLCIACTTSLAAAYAGLSAISGKAQGTIPASSPTQPPAPSQKLETAAPAAHPPPIAGSDAFKASSQKDGIDFDEFHRDEHTGISSFRNWIYTRGDTVITGATARYNAGSDTLDTDDPVVMNDSKHHLTADKAHVEHAQHDPSKRLVVLTGHAVMVLKPEAAPATGEVPPAPVQAPGPAGAGKAKVVSLSSQPPSTSTRAQAAEGNKDSSPPAADKDREDAKAQQRHGGTVTCDKIEYKTSKKFAILTGHVVFKQSFVDKDGKLIERAMTCEHAENDGKAEKLHLFKPVHYESSDGQVFDSREDVFAGTKEHEETLSMGRSHMEFTSQDEDEDTADSKDSDGKSTIKPTGKGKSTGSQ